MSKIGNHRVEVQESEAYRRGWESAERGEPSPDWRTFNSNILAEQLRIQRLGWQDYHDQEKSK